MNAKEVIKQLLDRGFTHARTKGSHKLYKKGEITITVPDHGAKDLKPGTLNSILKEAGIKLK